MVKLLGQRFTVLGVDDPVGAFFEALYQTGAYWHFLGLGQVAAGVLLLIPRTTTLGAIMFFPIVLNITVVTWSVGFRGTVYVASGMLLANVFLLCWDYDRFRHILFCPPTRVSARDVGPMPLIERLGYGVGALAGLVVLAAARNYVPTGVVRWMLLVGVVAIAMVLVGWVQLMRRTRLAGRDQAVA